MTRLIGKEFVAAAVAVGLFFVAANACAQSILNFKVAEDFRTAAKTHPQPSSEGAAGSFAVVKWDFPNGNAVSVTSSPATGKIVFIESDWGEDPAGAATDIPGLTFGSTKLDDIRRKFRSNGFGFRSNVVQVIGPNVVSFNCYPIAGENDLVVVFVTTLPISSVPTVAGQPDPHLGEGHLDAVILASLAYLKTIWGEDRIFDPQTHPIALN